jgi:hypothetical protein
MSVARTGMRAAFIIAYLAVQLALVTTADRRADRVFGFRMFNESSSLKFELYRSLRGRDERELIPVAEGEWQARDLDGAPHAFHWNDRVRYPSLTRPGVFAHASYGLDAQLFRLQRALDDVAAHIPQDAETRVLVALVDIRKNGRESGRLRLSSAKR